ncbi:MAG: NAD(P)/FAD-dependent oxidoreductase [candidate division KSB1 bacterium]|nr:NAD(P)/FAD-dependent oxidoreductase [candidate division KSB1 bacterium]
MSDDVVIVGGSLAGLYCAWRLAGQGVRVTVYDQLLPGQLPPRRTLIVTPELLNLVPEVVSTGTVRNHICAYRLRTDGCTALVPLSEADLVVERQELLRLLARLAQEKGAELRPGHALLHMVPTQEGLALQFLDRRRMRKVHLCARTVVAADGAVSRVARCAELDGRPRVPILQARVELPDGWDPHTVDTWFEPEATPYFFWLIPDSPRSAAVGLVAEDSGSACRVLSSFLSNQHLKPQGMEAAWVPLYSMGLQPVRDFGRARVYLVGDSAGQVKDTTVGGTVTGLKGAEAAASAIVQGLSYVDRLRDLRRELLAHHLLRALLNRFTRQDYQRLFAALNPRVLSLLAHHNRDHLATMLSRLVLAQPGLVVLAARSLLRAATRSPRRR